tara:strand:+ start:304 stop:519 length:216 start_codon:yes stop_codon:yes gene_type:complete
MDLPKLVDEYTEEYASAPMYKTYSQTLRKNIPTKSQVQSAFISNLQMLLIITDDQKIEDKITKILKKFELG